MLGQQQRTNSMANLTSLLLISRIEQYYEVNSMGIIVYRQQQKDSSIEMAAATVQMQPSPCYYPHAMVPTLQSPCCHPYAAIHAHVLMLLVR